MLPKGKPHEGQLFWVLLLSVGCTVVGSAWGSSSDLHLLSPSPGAPVPPALPRPEHPQGPRHHQPPVSIYRSPASLRGSHAGTTYIFGKGGGLITYTWPNNERPSTRTDRLAVGFSTTIKDGILVRIDSAPRLGDYIMLHIDQGKVSVTFNIGTVDISVKETTTDIDDGKYHLVRFTRNGGNATLQVDNWPVNEHFPTGNSDIERYQMANKKIPFKYTRPVEDWLQEKGRQLTIFNTQATISIGGNDRKRPYQGQLSGLYYNGLKVLNMAAEGHGNVKVNGSVRLVGDVPVTRGAARTTTSVPPEMSTTFIETTTTLSTTTTRKQRSPPTIQTTDDIVSSAECSSDDEDLEECDSGHADKILTTSAYEGGYKALAPKWEAKDLRPSKASEAGRTTPTAPLPDLRGTPAVPSDTPPKLPAGKMNNREVKPLQPDIVLLPLPTSFDLDGTKPRGPFITSPMLRTVPAALPTVPGVVRRVPPGASEVIRESSSTTGMVVGIVSAAALCILILLYAMYKYRNRDEGSYQVDETRNYISNSAQTNGAVVKDKAPSGSAKGSAGSKRPKDKDKEYYV
ncbi:neurexin-3b-beta-like isoform X3 [Notothenia coriiceps]|uniref:Neurexin-3b-beta-like isoform X3 n=1 Tax=Notothenia coriiceps TaxID=8208 RepID=A0A6I9MS41_9TELE|nr:PREDICTED: neurexin-3b-beta-like isoform X3 [Notothenia coriiceps]